jgi:hypothetical protein
MEKLLEEFLLVEKEDLKSLIFPENDVLTDSHERTERSKKVHKATSLGNLEHKKVHVLFADQEGTKRLYTTLWAKTGDKIIMRDSISLPVHRILDVYFED